MKKKLLILTNYCGIYTGLGRQCKNLLTYLYKHYSGKYEFCLAAMGYSYSNLDYQRFPWKIYGVLPDNPQELAELNKDPNRMRMASYGEFGIERIIHEFKPHFILMADDQWSFGYVKHRKFIKYIPTILMITLDSLPILPDAIETAKVMEHYWTWSEFAAREMRDKYNLKHVKCQYPCLDNINFYRLSDEERLNLRKRHNISENAFINGFVFRSQLRKLVNKLIEGYALFKKQNPDIKNTYLFTHTSYSEGWNIPELCKQYGVSQDEVLCTYICRATKEYFIMPFKGQDLDNPITKHSKSMITVDVGNGVTEKQLNEIYNLFDLYFQCSTSGSCEMPAVEAALAELIIATSPYSFGQDIIELNPGSIPLDYDLYTEIGTQFLKSNQKPQSIADAIKKVYEMPKGKKRELEKLSRQWALDNYSTEINAEKIIQYIDKLPVHNWNFQYPLEETKNPNAIIPSIQDNTEYILYLYKAILNMPDKKPADEDVVGWLRNLQAGQKKEDVENYFRQVANQKNQEIQQQQNQKSVDFSDFLIKNNKKSLLIVCPESAGDCIYSIALFKSFREKYPRDEFNIYLATKKEYFEIYDGQDDIDKVLEYQGWMDSEVFCTGQWGNKGYFDAFVFLTANSQRFLNYLTNDRINLELEEK